MGVGDHLVTTNRDFALSKGCFQRLKSSFRSASLNPVPETLEARLRAGKGCCPSPAHHLETSRVSSRVCRSTQAPLGPLRLRPRQEEVRGPTHPTLMGRAASPTSLATWLHGLGQKPGSLHLWMRGEGTPRQSDFSWSEEASQLNCWLFGPLTQRHPSCHLSPLFGPLHTSKAPPPRRLPKCNRRLWAAAAPHASSCFSEVHA